jgi:hypothetical protein
VAIPLNARGSERASKGAVQEGAWEVAREARKKRREVREGESGLREVEEVDASEEGT